jgi:methionine synthase II (cobalamin-independent)
MIKPFSTTGIGSLPHKNAEEACRIIIRTFDIPFWPQLPKISFREWMIPQYSEGLPFVRIDPERETIWLDKNKGDELERFYESYSEESRIAISEDYAKGLHTFLKTVRKKFRFLKGHITGPLTFTLGLKDSDGKPVYFDEELREISLMLLKAKVRWQIDVLKQFADNIIIFIDEPILSALGGSAYLGVNTEEAVRLIKETSDTVKSLGCLSGIHCCGNTDWPSVIKAGIDILNFDAYGYSDTLSIYPPVITEFLTAGGYLAWGIVPTTDSIRYETFDSLKRLLDQKIERLSNFIPSDLILSRIILTPSCGTGSRSIDEAAKILQLIIRLKEAFST